MAVCDIFGDGSGIALVKFDGTLDDVCGSFGFVVGVGSESYTQGKDGDAFLLEHNSSSDLAKRIIYTDDMGQRDVVSLSIWAKYTDGTICQDWPCYNACILSDRYPSNSSEEAVSLMITGNADDGAENGPTLKVTPRADLGLSDSPSVARNDPISADTYHHFVYIYDNINKILEVYVDGEIWYRNTFTNDVRTTNRLWVGIESDYTSSGKYVAYGLDGAVDHLRVFTRALSSDEVAQLYGEFDGSTLTSSVAFSSDTSLDSSAAITRSGGLSMASAFSSSVTPARVAASIVAASMIAAASVSGAVSSSGSVGYDATSYMSATPVSYILGAVSCPVDTSYVQTGGLVAAGGVNAALQAQMSSDPSPEFRTGATLNVAYDISADLSRIAYQRCAMTPSASMVATPSLIAVSESSYISESFCSADPSVERASRWDGVLSVDTSCVADVSFSGRCLASAEAAQEASGCLFVSLSAAYRSGFGLSAAPSSDIASSALFGGHYTTIWTASCLRRSDTPMGIGTSITASASIMRLQCAVPGGYLTDAEIGGDVLSQISGELLC